MSDMDRELQERIAALSPQQQRQVLDYLRELGGEAPRGMSGEEWLRGLPRISKEFAREIKEAVEEGRRVNASTW